MRHNHLKKSNLLLGIFILAGSLKSQIYTSTWMKGSQSADQPGIYGNIGVAATANNPGGREGAASWKDASGNFWLFGGMGYDCASNNDALNDLWKYSPSTNQWTFMKGDSTVGNGGVYGTMGTASSTNKPGARAYSKSWADASGNLWMFAGIGYDGSSNFGTLNDLWKYNIASNQWTWVRGSNLADQSGTYGTQGTAAAGNNPGGRYLGTSWTDASGNFWLFGGLGYDGSSNQGDLNDLWKYSPGTNQWTWLKGTNTINQNGIYGTMGTAAAGNAPGSRYAPTGWADASGNLWLFSGYGYDASNGTDDFLNDLWKYNITNNQWTWVKGSNSSGVSGTYGTINVPSASNIPGARGFPNSWIDASGNVYLFGGTGYDASSGFPDYLNDLWKYSASTNQWTWINGSSSSFQTGNYGLQGVPSVNNFVGSRVATSNWIDANNNLWVFGGNGLDLNFSSGEMNDLWKLETCIAPTINIAAASASSCPGAAVTLTATGGSTYSWSTSQAVSSITVTPLVTTTYVVVGITSTGCSNATVHVQTMLPSSTATLTASSTTACLGSSVTITASGATSYTWSNGSTGSSISITPTLAAVLVHTCQPAGSSGCFTPVTITITALANPIVGANSSKNSICNGETAVLTATGATSYSWHITPANANASITVNPSNTTTYVVTGTGTNGCKTTFSVTQIVNTCTGIDAYAADRNPISLYPNPNNGNFIIVTNTQLSEGSLVIMNAMGQQVYVQTVDSPMNNINANLSKGVYFYQLVKGQEKIASGKLVVE